MIRNSLIGEDFAPCCSFMFPFSLAFWFDFQAQLLRFHILYHSSTFIKYVRP